MTNEQILKKAIEKAVKNGWKGIMGFNEPQETFRWMFEEEDGRVSVSSVIFSHDFAKAFWGEESVVVPKNFMEAKSVKSWQYHLQQMVLEENPVKYLEQFL